MEELGIRPNRRSLLKSLAGASVALTVAGRAVAAPARPNTRQLRGLFPIGFTPITPDDKVDLDGMASQVAFLRRGRVPGIAWPQLASGWSTLTEKERMDGAEALTSAAKGGPTSIVIGVQSPDFAAVGRYAKQAERLGADAIICIPPAGVTDENALLDYYQQVGRMTALPFFTQAIGTMSVDLLVKMFETIPTMRYVKDESGEPLERVLELRRRTGDRLQVFSGHGVKTMITEMERGFVGHCPYVTIADVYQEAFEAWHAGNKSKAFEIFGAVLTASSMFSQSSVNGMIARGVFKPGTRTRKSPPVPGAAPANAYIPETSPEAIRRVLNDYMRPYLRA